ncbi:MAG: glycosyltransferase family 2 protein [Nitrososphaerales archaeon]
MPRVAVVIPSWNGRTLLAHCLEALTRQSEQDFVVIVVDNGSTDGTKEWLRHYHPSVQLISNASNNGFARAANEGIQASDAPYIAVLNNDTEPSTQWLAELLAAAETDPRIGMVASKMLFADRPDMINSAGICVDLAGIAWDRLGGAMDDPGEMKRSGIFGPCGGAALYRRRMLDEIGLFDESFFAYLEDVDLAWRGLAAGWRCLYAPEARVLHRHSATAVEGSPFKRYQLGRNKVWLLAKNYPFRALWWGGPVAVLYDVAAVLYALLARRDLHALRGRIAGLLTVAPYLGQRPRYKSRPDIALMSPLVPPWRVPARYAHLEKR